MANEIEKPVVPTGLAAPGVARRRLLRAGLAAAPVTLAVSGRSALATTSSCSKGLSPLAWNSLTKNGTQTCATTSHTVGSNPLGYSPGYWKPNCPNTKNQYSTYDCKVTGWPLTCVPYDGYPGTGTVTVSCSGGASDAIWDTGTKFNQVFVGSSETRSFSRILLVDNGSLNWHLCAAYLNALTVADYALTVKEVLDVAAGKIGSGTIITNQTVLKDYLAQTWA